jgi:hypothetical protein
VLLAALHKFPQKILSDTDFTELLISRNKSMLESDTNSKQPVWNGKVSNPSGLKLFELFVSSKLYISAPKCSKPYALDGR